MITKHKELKNSVVLKNVLLVIFKISSRRTSNNFAGVMIKVIIETLIKRFHFLCYIKIDEEPFSNLIEVDSKVDFIDIGDICKAIEAILRLVQADLETEASLFFITEFKKYASKEVMSLLETYLIDLELLQIEQHHIYCNQKKKKSEFHKMCTIEQDIIKNHKEESFNYNRNCVSTWKFDKDKNNYLLISKDGRIIDQVKSDDVVRSYINGCNDTKNNKYIYISEDENKLLNLLLSRDITEEIAIKFLKISNEKLFKMIHRLIKYRLLQYSNIDEVQLTEDGINYLSETRYK